MLAYFENNPTIFYLILIFITVYCSAKFHYEGNRSEAKFSGLENTNIIFREKRVSGYSKQSLRTRRGGASRVLDILVTDSELWIKGLFPMFSYIAEKYDLLHKIPLATINYLNQRNNTVEIGFTSKKGIDTHIILEFKKPKEFVKSIRNQEIFDSQKITGS